MSTGQTPLFCVFTLVLQLNLATAAVAAGCPMNPFNGQPKCNETCSKPPQIRFGGEFKCKVGFNAERYDFITGFGFEKATKITTPAPVQCKLPVLSAMSLHPLPYDSNRVFSPALNITFNVPFLGQVKQPELKAILLEFQSPLFTKTADEKFTDKEYSTNGGVKIYRLFNFSAYHPDTYDLDNPIKIDYTCLYGLDDCESGEKVYTITLTSLLSMMTNLNRGYYKCSSDTCYMCSVTYTFSVYAVRYKNWNNHEHTTFNRDYEKWNMTIATAFYPSPNDVYVILEPRKSIYNDYTIRLISDGHISKSKETTETTCIFEDVPPGTYKVQVVASISSGKTDIFTTYHTIVINGTDNGEKDDQQSVITVLAASVLGVSLAIFLLIILAWFKCRVSKSSQRGRSIEQPAYIILSNNDHASVKMSKEMRNALHDLGVHNVDCPENTATILRSIDEDNANATLIILCPVEHETFQFQISKDVVYEQTVESLAKYKKLNIVLIYFPYMRDAKPVRWDMLRKGKRICLMKDYEKMIRLLKIQHVNSRTLERVKSDLTRATEEARQVLMTYCETPPKSYDLPKERNIPCPHHRPHHNDDCPLHPRYKHSPPTYYLENEDMVWNGLNNDLTNLDNYDNGPSFDKLIIPPSPLASIKGKNDSEKMEGESVNTESSGYETSRVASSSDDNKPKSLADDVSLNREIQLINRQYLPEFNGEHIPLEIVDKQYFQDEETASEEDPMIAIIRSEIVNKKRLSEEETESEEDPFIEINFGV